MKSINNSTHALTCPFCFNIADITKFDNVLKCSNCKVMFQKYDTINCNKDIYGREYFQGKVYNNYFNEGQERERRFKNKIKLINKYIPQTGNILDVGCAAGFFLTIMKKSGYNTHGIDISSCACDYAKLDGHLNIVNENIFEAKYQDNYFDIITLWDVLEHVTEPELVIRELHRIIKNKGIIIIETLNINSLGFKILKKRWPLYSPEYHLFYYNKIFLIKLLEKFGFKIIKTFPIQTYVRLMDKIITIRYYDRHLLGKIFGKLFDDVILIVASK